MSELDFKERTAEGTMRFQSFYGKITDTMPLLLTGKDAQGETVDVPRTPITPKQLLYERVHGTHEDDRTLLQDNYFHTACAVISDPEKTGEILIGLHTNPVVQALIDGLNPESTLVHGALPVTHEHYQTIRKHAFVIPPDTANSLREYPYSEVSTREAFWEHITEGDPRLVKDTLALVQNKTSGGTMNDRMGLWLPTTLGLRLLGVYSVGNSGSGAEGNGLYYGGGRLAGVASRTKNLEMTVEETAN